MWKRGEIAPKEQFLLFSTIFSVYLYFQESNYIFICEMCLSDFSFFLNSANLIYRDTDISKYFRESIGLRDNESRPYFTPINIQQVPLPLQGIALLLFLNMYTHKFKYLQILCICTNSHSEPIQKSVIDIFDKRIKQIERTCKNKIIYSTPMIVFTYYFDYISYCLCIFLLCSVSIFPWYLIDIYTECKTVCLVGGFAISSDGLLHSMGIFMVFNPKEQISSMLLCCG